MATEEKKEPFLERWSRVKRESGQEKKEEEAPKPALPPVDKLTPESDFSPFMHPKVEDALRRVALKKLFSDPHFNIPDPYEPYSRDFTVGEPIPPELLATLNQAKQLLFGDKKEERQAEAPAEPEPQAKPDEPGKQDA
jgi:hypothetical protein